MSTTIQKTFLRLDFSARPNSITAVGGDFFSTTAGEVLVTDTMTVRITFFDNKFSTLTYSSPTAGEFAGFTTDTPIKRLQIGVANQYPTIDNIYVGEVTPVPEPAFAGIAAVVVCLIVVCHGFVSRARWKSRVRSCSAA